MERTQKVTGELNIFVPILILFEEYLHFEVKTFRNQKFGNLGIRS